MKLQDILLEKLPGGVKAKMLELTPVEPGQWKFTLRLVDPILSNVAMKWGYVTTALDSEDFDTKRVSNYYKQFKTEVLDNATEWVFATKKAPKKRTYGVRQVIETEVLALPKKTERTLDPNNSDKITDVELNTTKMKLLDRVRNIELFELPGKYPYEPSKTGDEENGAAETGRTGNGTGRGGKENNAAKTIIYDPSKSNVEDKNVQNFQQLIIDKLGSMMKGFVPEYDAFLRVGGPNGKYGSSTKKLIDFLEDHYKLTRTNGTKITPELQQKIKKQD